MLCTQSVSSDPIVKGPSSAKAKKKVRKKLRQQVFQKVQSGEASQSLGDSPQSSQEVNSSIYSKGCPIQGIVLPIEV